MYERLNLSLASREKVVKKPILGLVLDIEFGSLLAEI